MKALLYIKNNPQKALFICFIVLFISSLFTILFPGYTEVIDNNSYTPTLKTYPVGYIFSLISSGLDNNPTFSHIESIFLIILIAMYLLSSIIFIIVYVIKKHVLSLSSVFAFLIAIAGLVINFLIKLYSPINSVKISASYIFMLIIAAIAISIDIARLVHYFKTHPRAPRAPRQPRPHKLTSKERIAELEARVRELENKKNG